MYSEMGSQQVVVEFLHSKNISQLLVHMYIIFAGNKDREANAIGRSDPLSILWGKTALAS